MRGWSYRWEEKTLKDLDGNDPGEGMFEGQYMADIEREGRGKQELSEHIFICYCLHHP